MQQRRSYDHRLRALVCETRDLSLAESWGVPKNTALSWLHRGARTVVSAPGMEEDVAELRLRVLQLEQRVLKLMALLRLAFVLIRITGIRLDEARLALGSSKAKLLAAVERASPALPRSVALRILGISPSRYQSWHRKLPLCPLDDFSSCPKSHPSQLTPEETRTVKAMVTSLDFRHLSIRALALHAQRIGKVFAHPNTWMRLVRIKDWRRPLKRLHPKRPTLGIRASAPGEIVHIDVTILRLLDGTKAYLHAIIDNYSRRILAWKLAPRLDGANTCEILSTAADELASIRPPADSEKTQLFADSGVENVNGKVDALLDLHPLRRVLAQVEVSFSNSMIEAFWRRLKHQWLFLHSLDSLPALEKLIGFYVEQHNSLMPHSAFKGHTPDEIFFGREVDLPEKLAERRAAARSERLLVNRSLSCDQCQPTLEPPSLDRDDSEAA